MGKSVKIGRKGRYLHSLGIGLTAAAGCFLCIMAFVAILIPALLAATTLAPIAGAAGLLYREDDGIQDGDS